MSGTAEVVKWLVAEFQVVQMIDQLGLIHLVDRMDCLIVTKPSNVQSLGEIPHSAE